MPQQFKSIPDFFRLTVDDGGEGSGGSSGDDKGGSTTTTTPPPSGGSIQPLGDAGKRALEQEREARRDAERKLKEATEAAERDKLSEKQRLEKEAADAKSKADESEMKYLRLKVGQANKLPAELAERLKGSTEKELTEDAEALVKTLGGSAGGLDGGARGGAAAPDDMNAIIRKAAGR